MDEYINYLNLLLIACGFLIVLIARYGFSDFERKVEDDSFPHRRYSLNYSTKSGESSAATRRCSFSQSSSPTIGHSKRRGRRTFGIKHL